ncbi:MAG: DUF3592 domain-containing protein [Anaerolineae bacterium]|nr:DUF3592 domain-containing protein [Anaerolineae bacterium]
MARNIRTNVSKDYARLALYLFPENKEFLRGKRPQLVNNASNRTPFFSLLFIAASLILIGVTLFFGIRYIQLTTNVDTTQGVMLDSGISYGNDGNDYSITYAYAVDGQRYERSEGVNFSTYQTITSGAYFEVIYNRDEPTIATLTQPSLWLVVALAVFALLVNLFSWFVFFAGLRRGTWAKQLSERGLLLAGQVVKARAWVNKDDNGNAKNLWLDVTYSFTSPKTQQEVQGTSRNTRPELLSARYHLGKTEGFFAPGDPLLVMVADDKHHMVL